MANLQDLLKAALEKQKVDRAAFALKTRVTGFKNDDKAAREFAEKIKAIVPKNEYRMDGTYIYYGNIAKAGIEGVGKNILVNSKNYAVMEPIIKAFADKNAI